MAEATRNIEDIRMQNRELDQKIHTLEKEILKLPKKEKLDAIQKWTADLSPEMKSTLDKRIKARESNIKAMKEVSKAGIFAELKQQKPVTSDSVFTKGSPTIDFAGGSVIAMIVEEKANAEALALAGMKLKPKTGQSTAMKDSKKRSGEEKD